MQEIQLKTCCPTNKTIMIFVEGTIMKHKSWLTLYNHASYTPIGNSVTIIRGWVEQGANIVYCTSRRGGQAKTIADLLIKHGFVGTKLVFRSKHETYAKLVELITPDILIEDDCKSIGGTWQMCITKVRPEIKRGIISIAVKEFGGIDELPVHLSDFSN